jgi:hypothetical protein
MGSPTGFMKSILNIASIRIVDIRANERGHGHITASPVRRRGAGTTSST